MRRFQIINDKWIKEGIKSISLIEDFHINEENYGISLIGGSNTVHLSLDYNSKNKEQFYDDLKFLENLLHNQ
jgi:hypothetical protein